MPSRTHRALCDTVEGGWRAAGRSATPYLPQRYMRRRGFLRRGRSPPRWGMVVVCFVICRPLAICI